MLDKEYAAERAELIDFRACTCRKMKRGRVIRGRSWIVCPMARRSTGAMGLIHTPNGCEGCRTIRLRRRARLGSDTTHFCVVDRWGNAVGELQSIQMGYGSGLIAGNTGVLLNNRMTYWHLDPDHIDFLRPGSVCVTR